MNTKELLIRIGAARADLQKSYQLFHRTLAMDSALQADLHCRYIAGIDTRFAQQVEILEELEDKLQISTERIDYPRWRMRKNCMEDIIQCGGVRGESNIQRAAAFITTIENHLVNDSLPATETKKDEVSALSLLHPVIVKSSLSQFHSGQFRDAVFNAFVALGDLIRLRTGLSQDGKALVEQALSLSSPILVLSNLSSESGKNDQTGFMQILSGAFVGIRNPKAHSLSSDLDSTSALQYLVFASLLARRISNATVINTESINQVTQI